jgi:hypothetical protein
MGCGRFITNNQRDFAREIDEVAVTYPDDLPDPGDDGQPAEG